MSSLEAQVEDVLDSVVDPCMESVRQGLLALPEVEAADVTLDADFSWTEESMSEGYRARLAAHRTEVLRTT